MTSPSLPTRRSSDLAFRRSPAPAPANGAEFRHRPPHRPPGGYGMPDVYLPSRAGPFVPHRLSCQLDIQRECEEECGSLRSEEHTSELQSLAYLVCRL